MKDLAPQSRNIRHPTPVDRNNRTHGTFFRPDGYGLLSHCGSSDLQLFPRKANPRHRMFVGRRPGISRLPVTEVARRLIAHRRLQSHCDGIWPPTGSDAPHSSTAHCGRLILATRSVADDRPRSGGSGRTHRRVATVVRAFLLSPVSSTELIGPRRLPQHSC